MTEPERDTQSQRDRAGVIYPLGPSGMACTWRQTSSTVEPGSSSSSWKGAWWKSSWSSSSLICSRARTLLLYSALVHLQPQTPGCSSVFHKRRTRLPLGVLLRLARGTRKVSKKSNLNINVMNYKYI